MSKKYLGNTLDIHMGGIEHIPVHHTNEIAQSESANGVKFANYWLHNEHLLVDNKKMAKSEGSQPKRFE
jgi:cysteinyl-tRNA synthetase